MRNWNYETNNSSKVKKNRFYSTYEELKLCGEQGSGKTVFRFYSTYEELKQ